MLIAVNMECIYQLADQAAGYWREVMDGRLNIDGTLYNFRSFSRLITVGEFD